MYIVKAVLNKVLLKYNVYLSVINTFVFVFLFARANVEEVTWSDHLTDMVKYFLVLWLCVCGWCVGFVIEKFYNDVLGYLYVDISRLTCKSEHDVLMEK